MALHRHSHSQLIETDKTRKEEQNKWTQSTGPGYLSKMTTYRNSNYMWIVYAYANPLILFIRKLRKTKSKI